MPSSSRPAGRSAALLDSGVRALSATAASESIRVLMDHGVAGRLREGAWRRISVYNPAWTDYNSTDPGVTILEVVAYTIEDLHSRFTQLAEPACSKFSTLLHARPKAAHRRG